MSAAPKKNSFLDIYVQSIQKDNAFFKEKVSSLQKELEDVKAKNSEERKGFQQELSALKEDLSRMVNDVANLRSQNGALTEKLEEYEASYVPGSGSKKLKDALGDCRKQLRETVAKYNELVDGYDVAKEQYNSALLESNTLREDNARLTKELERYQQLYQSSTKELEENRQDIAVYMKENSELRQAMEDRSAGEIQSSQASTADGTNKLVVALRAQLQHVSGMLERMKSRDGESTRSDLSSSFKDAQSKLDALSTKTNSLISTLTSDSSPQVIELVGTASELRLSLLDLDSALQKLAAENRELRTRSSSASVSSSVAQRANDAEKKLAESQKRVKELSETIVQLTNERDRYRMEAEEGSGTQRKTASQRELEKRADDAERKVIELSQRTTTYERRVNELSRRAATAENQVKDLSSKLQAVTQERDSLQRLSAQNSAELSRTKAEARRVDSSQQEELQKQLREKDRCINELRESVAQLEKTIEDYRQNPPIPDIPDELQLPDMQMLSEPVDMMNAEDSADPSLVEAESSEYAVTNILQQMLDDPESFNLDTIDDVSFPECDFNDHHMELFTRFLRENDFPSLVKIDLSRRGGWMVITRQSAHGEERHSLH